MKTSIQKVFAPFKVVLPRFVWTRIRGLATAVITPVVFSRWSGHFLSSLEERAVTPGGQPLPWYTYPCIQLLAFRDFSNKSILEFGGGQSTLWWAARARHVVTIESDAQWHAQIAGAMPGWRSWTTVSSLMTYPSFVENGDSIIARIRRPYLISSPTFGYSSAMPNEDTLDNGTAEKSL